MILLVLLVGIGSVINFESSNSSNKEEINNQNKDNLGKGFKVEDDEKEFNDEIFSIIKELEWEKKIELTKSEVGMLLKKLLKKESDIIQSEDSPQFLKDSVMKMFKKLETEIMDSVPDTIKYEDLGKYITFDKMIDLFEKLMTDVIPQMDAMGEDSFGIGEKEYFEDAFNNLDKEINDDL